MDNTKNALAELAECLSNDAEYLYGNNDKASEDVSKAQRIVAELAKVESMSIEINKERYSYESFKKCRAIAEEGGAR